MTRRIGPVAGEPLDEVDHVFEDAELKSGTGLRSTLPSSRHGIACATTRDLAPGRIGRLAVELERVDERTERSVDRELLGRAEERLGSRVRSAIVMASTRSRLFPMPASPSMNPTAPAPDHGPGEQVMQRIKLLSNGRTKARPP